MCRQARRGSESSEAQVGLELYENESFCIELEKTGKSKKLSIGGKDAVSAFLDTKYSPSGGHLKITCTLI